MSRRHRCRWNSFGMLQSIVADDEFALLQALFEPRNIQLDVFGNRMARWQIIGFDLRSTTRTIEFDDANPIRIWREIELTGHDQWMNLAWIAVVQEASLFVIFMGLADRAA